MKKEEELAIANFSITRINSLYNFNYHSIPNENESNGESDVDIYAIYRTKSREEN